jgi:outer membrane protein assembly factor BamA
VKVQEIVNNVTPKLQLYLPNGALDLNLAGGYKETSVRFSSKYDFVDSFIGFDIDFRVTHMPLTYGIDIYDRVDFSEFYTNTEHFQRVQAIAPYSLLDLGGPYQMKSGIAFEKTFSQSVDDPDAIEQGRNVAATCGIWRNTVLGTKGSISSLSVTSSLEALGSDYSFTQLELTHRKYYPVTPKNYFENRFVFGYPVSDGSRPQMYYYSAGGYLMLGGYGFKEFRGDALMYTTVSYNIPVRLNPNAHVLVLSASEITFRFFSELAKIGSKEVYTTPDGFKASVGVGLSHNAKIFKNLPVGFGVSLAKAFAPEDIQFYLTLNTNYMTWLKPQ